MTSINDKYNVFSGSSESSSSSNNMTYAKTGGIYRIVIWRVAKTET